LTKKKWQEGSNNNWANDSVFQAKSGGQVFMKDPNKSWMDYYREDQAKKKQEAAKGQVRFREASTASRIQYTNPTYTGNSKNANYKWETQALKDVKMPKHSSRTYNSKFDYLTKQMGLSSAQADDFRKYMDFGEDQSKTKYDKNMYNTDKNGNTLKTSYPEGSSLNTKNDIIDGILSGMSRNAVNAVKYQDKLKAEKAKTAKTAKKSGSQAKQSSDGGGFDLSSLFGGGKASQPHTQTSSYGYDPSQQYQPMNESDVTAPTDKYSKANAVLAQMHQDNTPNPFSSIGDTLLHGVDAVNKGLTTAYDHTLGPVQDWVNRALVNANDQVALGQFKKNVNAKNAPKFVQDAVKAPTNNAQKAADVTGNLAGFAASLALPYKAAGPISKVFATTKYGQAAVRGALANGGLEGTKQLLDEAIHPNDGTFDSRTKDVLLNAALGGAADVGMLGLGQAGSNLLGRMAKTDGPLPSYNGQVADEVLNKLAPKQAGTTNGSSSNIYDNLIKQANPGVKEADNAIAAAQQQKKQLEDEFVKTQLFTPKGPGMPHPQYPTKQVLDTTREQFQHTPQAKQIDEVINSLLGQRESAVNAPASGPIKINDWQSKVQDPTPVPDVSIHSSQDNVQAPVNEPVSPTPTQTPKTETQINEEMVQQAKHFRDMTDNPEEIKALDNLINELTGKKPAVDLKAKEDAFVAEQMKPHYDRQQKQAEAQVKWQQVVKEAKDKIDHIKGTFGKIYVPSHSLEDYPVPKQFLASSKDKHSDDIFSFAEQMGFHSPEEAVNVLQVLDADSKVKLKEMMPGGEDPVKPTDLRYLEESLRKKFRSQNDNVKTDAVINTLEGKPSPKPELNVTTEETASTIAPETSSTMKPLGIMAGDSNQSAYSWMGSKPTTMEKVKSGDITAKSVAQFTKTQLSSTAQVIKDTVKDIAKLDTGGTLEKFLNSKQILAYGDNLYKQLRGVSRSVGRAINASKKDYGKIITTLRKNKISTDDFNAYVSNVHFKDIIDNNMDKAVRRGEVSKRLDEIEAERQATNDKKDVKALDKEETKLLKEKTSLDAYELPAGVTEDSVNAILDRWKNTPVMKQMQKEFVASQHKDLQMLADSGVYSQSEVDHMVNAHPNYVYMGRVKEERQMMNPSNVSKVSDYIKKRTTGSDEKIYPPLESAVRNRLMAYSNASRNEAMQTIEKYAGINGVEKYFKEVNPATLSESQKKNLVKFFKDGKEVYYQVPPALKDGFDSLSKQHADDLIVNALRAVGNITRKGATHLNTDFIFSSPFRETGALITSRTNLHPGELVLGYLDSFMGKGLEKYSGGLFKSYKDVYKELGGHQTGFVTTDPQSTKAFIKAMDKGTLGKGIDVINPFNDHNIVGKIGQNVEHGPKLAEFRSAKNKGLDNANAMHEATDVIDYNEGGKAIKALNHIPYLGASMRGTIRYMQAAKENPANFIGKNALYVTLPTLGIYAMRFAPTTSDGQREKLRNLSDFQKNAFWYIPVPNSKDDRLLAFPKLYVGAQLFANPIERILDHVTGEDPTTFAKFVKSTGTDFTKLMPPTTIAGLSQLGAANANFDPLMDMPIEDAAMQRDPNNLNHYNSFTSEASKGFSKVVDKASFGTIKPSPAKVDYILKSLTGGSGRDLLDVADNTLAQTGLVKRPQKVDTTLDILNPSRRFVYKDTSAPGTTNRLYNQQKQDAFNGNKEADSVRLYKEMKDLNKQIKDIREDTSTSSAEKKQAISDLRKQQRSIGDEAIKLGILKNR
jgi:hypothetical protein